VPGRSWIAIGVPLLLLAGCGGGPTEPQSPPRPLPARFQLQGSASSVEADGTSVSCALFLVVELAGRPREAPGVLEYEGTLGGELRRTVLDAAGNGISLEPDVYGKVVVRSLTGDQVEITTPVNTNAEGRFWRELSRLEGTFDSGGTGSGNTATGAWNCAPFDISNGYVDTRYTARGTWTLLPAP
jgi:hypothetical protein